jgi:hypothetical protein
MENPYSYSFYLKHCMTHHNMESLPLFRSNKTAAGKDEELLNLILSVSRRR